MTWPLTTLGDIFEVARGGSPRPIDEFFTDDPNGVNWILISDASGSSKYINSTQKKIKLEGAAKSRIVKPGDFLLTNSMSFGRPYILNVNGCIHDGWLVLSPFSPAVDRNYFFHLLGSPEIYQEFARRAAGATVKNLNIDLVRGVQVRLPPLPEQKRIAAILDQANQLRRARKTSLNKIAQLPGSIFDEMFEPTKSVARTDKLGAHLSFVTSGGRGWAKYYASSGKRFVRSLDVQMNKIGSDDVVFVNPPENAEAKRTRIAASDVLLTITGSRIGRVAAAPRELVGGYISQHVAILRPKSSINPVFLAWYLSLAEGGQKQIAKAQYGQTKPGLNFDQIRDFRIPVPSISMQNEFVIRSSRVDRLLATQQSHLDRLDALFTSLQHHAFRGELTSKAAERELAEAS